MSDPEETWKPVARDEEGREYPGYEVSDHGNYRSVDRTLPSGRRAKGRPLIVRTSNRGYGLVDLRDADGNKVTRSAHKPVLETHHKLCPPGMEARHLDDNPLRNVFVPASTEEESRARGGNLWWGTKSDQHRDKVRNNNGEQPPVPAPSHDCINHAQCGGKTRNPGKRCVPCVEQVGRDAADRLRAGENLRKVAERFGYKGTDWTYTLAVKHGGYQGSRDDALTQGRRWSQRVTKAVRKRLHRGDAPSPPSPPAPRQQGAKAGTAPFGRVSPHANLGHSGHPRTPDVTQSKTPPAAETARKVTQSSRPHVPYPSDTVRYRAPRKPGGAGRTR